MLFSDDFFLYITYVCTLVPKPLCKKKGRKLYYRHEQNEQTLLYFTVRKILTSQLPVEKKMRKFSFHFIDSLASIGTKYELFLHK